MKFRDDFEAEFWKAVYLRSIRLSGNPIRAEFLADAATLSYRERRNRD